MKKRQKIVVIVGPTSSGKSALAVMLARRFNGEVISADSRQVYKGLNIGTGKITKREMQGVPHHLLDIVSPKTTFTAHKFITLAREAHSNILQNDRMTIVAGGSGFYIDAFLGRVSIPDVPIDEKLRARLEKHSPEELFEMLQKQDPQRALSIDRHNKHRLIRALEVAGHTYEQSPPPFETLWIGLSIERAELRKKIHDRLLGRVKLGMIAEAERLHANGLSYKRMEQLGLEYRFLARLLQKKLTRERFLTQLETAIAQYAKRQMTYWRRNKDIQWFPSDEEQKIIAAVSAFLKK